MRLSGDGFVTLEDGSRRWGRFGAAGILVRHVDGHGETSYFLARRSVHTHLGGTWAIPGGALDQGETPLQGAMREFEEEIGVELRDYVVALEHEDDHGGWSYWTLVVDVADPFPAPQTLTWETAEARWVRVGDLADLELFGAFARTLSHLGLA